jgi:hypothetical protein
MENNVPPSQHPGYGPAQPYPPQGQFGPNQPVQQPGKTNGLAIASLICAFIMPILGIILGIISLGKIKQTGEGGRGMAMFGIIGGAVFTISSIIASIFFINLVLGEIDDTFNDDDWNSSWYNDDDGRDNSGNNNNNDRNNNGGNSGSTAEFKTRAINQTINDAELGYTFIIKQLATNVPIDAGHWSIGSHIGVGIEIEIRNHSEYISSISSSAFELIARGNGQTANSIPFQNHVATNGLENLGTTSVSRGNTLTGWFFFSVNNDTNLDNLVFRYARRESRITQIGGSNSGEQKTIPARNFDINL